MQRMARRSGRLSSVTDSAQFQGVTIEPSRKFSRPDLLPRVPRSSKAAHSKDTAMAEHRAGPPGAGHGIGENGLRRRQFDGAIALQIGAAAHIGVAAVLGAVAQAGVVCPAHRAAPAAPPLSGRRRAGRRAGQDRAKCERRIPSPSIGRIAIERIGAETRRAQMSRIRRAGSSRPSFTRTRKVTASLPSTMR